MAIVRVPEELIAELTRISNESSESVECVAADCLQRGLEVRRGQRLLDTVIEEAARLPAAEALAVPEELRDATWDILPPED